MVETSISSILVSLDLVEHDRNDKKLHNFEKNMRTKFELDQAAEELGISVHEIESVREHFNSERSIADLLRAMNCQHDGNWQQVRFRLMFSFDFTPKHFSIITAWRRKENAIFNDEWLAGELSEKMESAKYLYE